ncbi:MAG: cupin domain-containing protein [Acidimicrobiales bacterium]
MNSPLVDAAPIITRSPEPYIAGRTEIRLLSGTHTGAAIGAIDYLIGPGFGPPPILHRHTREDAGWFVLDGEIEFAFADGTVVRAGPGDTVVHPRGCWFRWTNPNVDRTARAICWFSPAGFEQFFVDVATRARDHLESGGTVETFTPTLLRLRLRYGDETHPDATIGAS